MKVRKYEIQVREFDDFDDLAIAVIELNQIRNGYRELGLDVPDWLTEKVHEGKVELDSRMKIRKQRELSKLKIKRQMIATPDEKRSRLDEEIKKLEDQLK